MLDGDNAYFISWTSSVNRCAWNDATYMDDSFKAGKGGWHQNYDNSMIDEYERLINFWRWWTSFLYHGYNPFLGQRIGEAEKPGPFTVSGLNVQCLNAFVDDGRFTSSTSDVVVFSETAATNFVNVKACKAARRRKCHYKHGSDVNRRDFVDGRICETKGTAQGVGILSKLPLRNPRQDWDSGIWNSARVVDTIVVTDCGPIRIFGMYGLHQTLPD